MTESMGGHEGQAGRALHDWVAQSATAALAAARGLSQRLLLEEFEAVPQCEMVFSRRPRWLLEGRTTGRRFGWDELAGLEPDWRHPGWTPEFEVRFRRRSELH